MRRSFLLMVPLFALGCATAPVPEPLTQAEAVSGSPASEQAKEFAPEAHAAADKLRDEASWLHEQGRSQEAGIAGEQAIAAYNEAFSLARLAQAEERLESAKKAKGAAAKTLSELDELQAQIAKDADAYEMRARVHLDREEVKDEEKLSTERIKARRLAAKNLAAEAKLLCLSTRLLGHSSAGLDKIAPLLDRLNTELAHGSIKADLYPRATTLRARCLKELTTARRSDVRKAPESAASDKLLTLLSETGSLFVYRDDRGVVANLPAPLSKAGALTPAAEGALKILGGTAKSHPEYPLLVVTHTKKAGDKKGEKELETATLAALKSAGAPEITVSRVGNAQPLVSPRLRGGAAKNERVEVIFVSPGR